MAIKRVPSYTQITGKSPFEGIKPTETPALEGEVVDRPPITTSEEAKGIMGDIDTRLAQYEMPVEEKKFEELYGKEEQRLETLYQQRKEEIERATGKRVETAEAKGKAIVSESRAALASMGLISTEPELTTATGAVQYIADVKTENKKQVDEIMQEEQDLLSAARDARDSKQYQMAQDLIKQANERRQERNKIRQQALSDVSTMRQLERQGRQDEIIELQEKRAAEQFNTERAENALKYIDFDDFEQYSPNEVKKLEQAIGLPDGSLEKYASANVRLKALEGWESKVSTDKTTGEVTATYVRLNPKTGKPESMSQSLGFIGERYAEEKGTSMMQEYGLAQEQGFTGSLIDFKKEMAKAGRAPAKATGGFTSTEKRKLEQAGLLNADRQEQLNFLYGDDDDDQFKQIETNLVAEVGKDGFVSPNDYAFAKQDWIQTGGEPAEFDKEFEGRRNPENPNYELTEKEEAPATIEEFKTSIKSSVEQLKNIGYSRNEAKDYILTEYKDMPKTIKDLIENELVETYGRTLGQKIIPGGR